MGEVITAASALCRGSVFANSNDIGIWALSKQTVQSSIAVATVIHITHNNNNDDNITKIMYGCQN